MLSEHGCNAVMPAYLLKRPKWSKAEIGFLKQLSEVSTALNKPDVAIHMQL